MIAKCALLLQSKFTECKRELGFCIPGFQVHKISNNELVKFNKDYGKNLNKETISEGNDKSKRR